MSFLPKTYDEGIADAVSMIDSVINHPEVDSLPASFTLKLIRHTLLNPEDDND